MQPVRRTVLHIIMEGVCREQASILRIQAEHDTHRDHRQRHVFDRIVRVPEAFSQRIMQLGHVDAGFDAQLFLSDNANGFLCGFALKQARQFVDMIRQIREHELGLRFAGNPILFEVVDAEQAEIAGNQYGRLFRWRKIVRIPFRLLDWREHQSLAFLRLVQVHAQ